MILHDTRNIIIKYNIKNADVESYIFNILNNNIESYNIEVIREVNICQLIKKYCDTVIINNLNDINTVINLKHFSMFTQYLNINTDLILANALIFKHTTQKLIRSEIINNNISTALKSILLFVNDLDNDNIKRYALMHINIIYELFNDASPIDIYNILKSLELTIPAKIKNAIEYYSIQYIASSLLSNTDNLLICYSVIGNLLHVDYFNKQNCMKKILNTITNNTNTDYLELISIVDAMCNFNKLQKQFLISGINFKTVSNIVIHNIILQQKYDTLIIKNYIFYSMQIFDTNLYQEYFSLLFKRLQMYYIDKDITKIDFENQLLENINSKHINNCIKLINEFKQSLSYQLDTSFNFLITSMFRIPNIDLLYTCSAQNLINANSIVKYIHNIENSHRDIQIEMHLLYGKVKVKLNNNIITMLPIHYLILANDLSTDINHVTHTCNTLGISNVQMINNIHKSFTGLFDNKNINLIENFYNIISNLEIKSDNHTLAYNKIELIKSMAMNILTYPMCKYNLFTHIKSKISKYYTISYTDYTNSINELIKLDYISYDNDLYNVITY